MAAGQQASLWIWSSEVRYKSSNQVSWLRWTGDTGTDGPPVSDSGPLLQLEVGSAWGPRPIKGWPPGTMWLWALKASEWVLENDIKHLPSPSIQFIKAMKWILQRLSDYFKHCGLRRVSVLAKRAYPHWTLHSACWDFKSQELRTGVPFSSKLTKTFTTSEGREEWYSLNNLITTWR